MSEGIVKNDWWSLTPKNYHMARNYEVATRHYIKAGDMFYEDMLIKAPALFMVSQTDPMGTVQNTMRAHESWQALGIQSWVKCWADSPHVGHLRKHPTEYVAEWSQHLTRAGLMKYPEKFRAKL